MGDGSLLLVLPGQNGLHVAPEVCVWTQEGVKQQGHGALAPALEAFGQVIQVLGVVRRSEGLLGQGCRALRSHPNIGVVRPTWKMPPSQKERVRGSALKALTSPAAELAYSFAEPGISRAYGSRNAFSGESVF